LIFFKDAKTNQKEVVSLTINLNKVKKENLRRNIDEKCCCISEAIAYNLAFFATGV